MAAAEHVRELIEPIIEQNGAELYDLEFEGGVLRVAVDREGGIDVDTIGEISKLVSDVLDHEDPIPDAKYLLEVTSPGVERKLRTPQHFSKQVGETVSLKVRTPIDGARRLQSTLVSVDDDGITVEHNDGTVHIAFADIEAARSVFDWDAQVSDTRKSTDKSDKKKAVS